jgi:hypothetical protein
MAMSTLELKKFALVLIVIVTEKVIRNPISKWS